MNDSEKFPNLNKYVREKTMLDFELEEDSKLMNTFATLFESLDYS